MIFSLADVRAVLRLEVFVIEIMYWQFGML